MKSIIYIGMDVHSKTFDLCAVKGMTGEIIAETHCAAEVSSIVKFIEKLKKENGEDCEFKTGYEAGCLGYSLHNQLTDKGIDCDILAPTTMQKSAKNTVKKNDRMDARNVARNLASGTYKAVYVPDEEDIEVKEYIRMIDDFKDELKKVKQHINALLLRHGYQYGGKSKWTQAHMKWLKDLELSHMYREIINEYLLEYDALVSKIERFTETLAEISDKERYNQPVSYARCFKGIDTLSAMTVHVEISDFNRFPNAKAFASYLGLTPGESSSGEKTYMTGITKQGNTTVRSTLVECAQALVKGTPGVKSKAVKARQKGQPQEVIAYADKATERLQRRYQKMIYRGVNRNKAITAVARELACFIWGMETGNIN